MVATIPLDLLLGIMTSPPTSESKKLVLESKTYSGGESWPTDMKEAKVQDVSTRKQRIEGILEDAYIDEDLKKETIDRLESLYKEELLAVLDAAEAVIPYLEPSTAHDLLYRTPAMAMREAADDMDRKEAAIARLKTIIAQERSKLTP